MARRRQFKLGILIGALILVPLLAAAVWQIYSGWRIYSELRHERDLPSLDPRPVVRFAPRFPKSVHVEGLLDPPVELDRGLFEPSYSFEQGPGGASAFWRVENGQWTALNEDLSQRGEMVRLSEGEFPLAWVSLREGSVLRLDAGTPSEDVGLTAFRADGSTAWVWTSPFEARGYDSYCILYDQEGPAGVALAFGGDTGLVALDLNGDLLWRLPRVYVVYDVTSHPGMPDYLLQVGGDAMLLGSATSMAGPTVLLGAVDPPGRRSAGTYITAGCLFPDGDGRPALVVTGQVGREPPVIVRLDSAGRIVWRAVLPSEAEGLGLLEPEGGPRLFVVATQGGEILVVGDDGTLYANQRMPSTSEEHETAIYGLSTGEFRPGVPGVAVWLLQQQIIYRLHPERIAPR